MNLDLLRPLGFHDVSIIYDFFFDEKVAFFTEMKGTFELVSWVSVDIVAVR